MKLTKEDIMKYGTLEEKKILESESREYDCKNCGYETDEYHLWLSHDCSDFSKDKTETDNDT